MLVNLLVIIRTYRAVHRILQSKQSVKSSPFEQSNRTFLTDSLNGAGGGLAVAALNAPGNVEVVFRKICRCEKLGSIDG